MFDIGNLSQYRENNRHRVLDDMSLSVFDGESVRGYRNLLLNGKPNHVWNKTDDETFLQKLGAVGRAEDGVLHPTGAGLLMFGCEHEIVREYPDYFLDYQETAPESYGCDKRWNNRIISSSGDWSGNIFEFFFKVMPKLTSDVKIPFKMNGIFRVDDTPVHKALREAVANALIHSDYYEPRGIVIKKLDDRITIANLGAMRISIEDAISGGVSEVRNGTLMKMFNLIDIGERAGSGIPSIRETWLAQGWSAPVLSQTYNPDRTALSLEMPM